MILQNNLSEISAEMLLNYMYPEIADKLTVRMRGTFYRNYSSDVLELDETGKVITLSRDGFLRLLPQGLLTYDDELHGKEIEGKHEALKRRRLLLEETFMPLDTFAFRYKLQIEREVSELLNMKLDYILKDYFHFDLSSVTNRYVREAAVMLPYVSRLRGNFGFVASLLTAITGYKTKMLTGAYSETDNTRAWLPWVKYHLKANQLTAEQYTQQTAEMVPLTDFIREWFIPFDMRCDIELKEYSHRPLKLDDGLALNYNTSLKN